MILQYRMLSILAPLPIEPLVPAILTQQHCRVVVIIGSHFSSYMLDVPSHDTVGTVNEEHIAGMRLEQV